MAEADKDIEAVMAAIAPHSSEFGALIDDRLVTAPDGSLQWKPGAQEGAKGALVDMILTAIGTTPPGLTAGGAMAHSASVINLGLAMARIAADPVRWAAFLRRIAFLAEIHSTIVATHSRPAVLN